MECNNYSQDMNSKTKAALRVSNRGNLVIKSKIGHVAFTFILHHGFFDSYQTVHIESHNHAMFECQFITEGTGSIRAGEGEWISMEPGDYFLIGSNLYHEQRIDTEKPITKYSILMDYEIDALETDTILIEEGGSVLRILQDIGIYKGTNGDRLIKYIGKARQELQHQWVGYYSRVQSYLNLMLVEMLRDSARWEKASYKMPVDIHNEKSIFIIEEFFDLNYHTDVKAEDLARLLHVSTRQLSRIMNENYQMTFKQKLLETRIEVAKNLLKNTSETVNQVARRVGYESESSFFAMFKRKTNETPRAYRERYRMERDNEIV